MAQVVVLTDDGREVSRFAVDDDLCIGIPLIRTSTKTWANLIGLGSQAPNGWLGRALRDARVIQAGGDPEQPSEKAMRMLAERVMRVGDLVEDREGDKAVVREVHDDGYVSIEWDCRPNRLARIHESLLTNLSSRTRDA